MELFRSIREAGETWRKELGQKMIFLIEDLHDAKIEGDKAFQICGPLLELYSDGYANVIYSISDYSAISRFLKRINSTISFTKI